MMYIMKMKMQKYISYIVNDYTMIYKYYFLFRFINPDFGSTLCDGIFSISETTSYAELD